ncbi:MAG: DUF4476 domain-containing protein [Spirochaetales bacterium]|nr:DUF4476 domain-containing protein [Spirochaetales bacterium]
MQKNIIFSLFTLVLAVASVFAETEMDKKVDELFKRLDEIESAYISQIKFNDRREAIEKVNQMVAILEEIRKMKTVEKQTEYISGDRISDSDFKIFMELLRGNKDRQDRLKWIRLFGRSSYFTVGQLIEIMKLYETDEERIYVVEAILGHITDFDRAKDLRNLIRLKKADLDRIIKHHEILRSR